ncbi:hypothetical protein [Actinophytocola xanthii]|uniref:hypothetical protein n=1 Tax=Actinophytocola xanthii TaxID=1912961 RepID=UPI00117800AF|nr:hypothetical protein [Actinophytocola xanthii]
MSWFLSSHPRRRCPSSCEHRPAETQQPAEPPATVGLDLRTLVLLLLAGGAVWLAVAHPALAVAMLFGLTVLWSLDRLVRS